MKGRQGQGFTSALSVALLVGKKSCILPSEKFANFLGHLLTKKL